MHITRKEHSSILVILVDSIYMEEPKIRINRISPRKKVFLPQNHLVDSPVKYLQRHPVAWYLYQMVTQK